MATTLPLPTVLENSGPCSGVTQVLNVLLFKLAISRQIETVPFYAIGTRNRKRNVASHEQTVDPGLDPNRRLVCLA
jgi:hypothetical protein